MRTSAIRIQGTQSDQSGYVLQVTIGRGVDAGQVEAWQVEVPRVRRAGRSDNNSGKNERLARLGTKYTRHRHDYRHEQGASARGFRTERSSPDKGEYAGDYVEVEPAMQGADAQDR